MSTDEIVRYGDTPDSDIAGGFPSRLAKLIGEHSVRAFARIAGVSDTFLRQCLAGRTEPTRTKLIAIARAGGTTVEWLATGRGSPTAAAEPGRSSAAAPDPELLASIIEITESVLEEGGPRLAPAEKAQVICALYEMYEGSERPAISRETILKLAARPA